MEGIDDIFVESDLIFVQTLPIGSLSVNEGHDSKRKRNILFCTQLGLPNNENYFFDHFLNVIFRPDYSVSELRRDEK